MGFTCVSAIAHQGAHAVGANAAPVVQAWQPAIPDTRVLDQDGRERRFYADLVQGRTVAISFIYTSCTTVCPVTTATLREVQQRLKTSTSPGGEVSFISVSVDPATDRPAVLKAFAQRHAVASNWTFVTGDAAQISLLLKAFGVETSEIDKHTPLVYIGDDLTKSWTRVSGLASPDVLVKVVKALQQASASRRATAATTNANALPAPRAQLAPAADTAERDRNQDAARYFTNLRLVDQDGRNVRFYDDMIRNQTVLINVMFTGCSSTCSTVTTSLARVQELLRSDAPNVRLISITIDPLNDTPAVLKAFATAHGVGDGWTFLTGDRKNVDWVLYKLGGYSRDPMAHTNILLVGNDAAGYWTKALATDAPAAIAAKARQAALAH